MLSAQHNKNYSNYHLQIQISLIHNGIDLHLINSAKTKKSANFIYFGRLEKHKRIDRSIEVFNELIKLNPKYTFEIIGDGSHKKAVL